MAEDLRLEHVRNQIRESLRNNKVKLWLPPYFDNNTPVVSEMEKLSEKYSTQLKMSNAECLEALYFLQQSAQTKLREQSQFSSSGLASLRVRVCGLRSPGTSGSSPTHNQQFTVEVMLSATGEYLEQVIAEKYQIPNDSFKLICNGRIISSERPLYSQSVLCSSLIMVVILNGNRSEVDTELSYQKLLEETRSAVRTMYKGSTDGHRLELEDQHGNAILLPPKESDALRLALALYERGYAARQKKNYTLALVFYLEADKELSNCNSDLIQSVDNAALLNLEIVWCYLCLRSVTHIADAQKRLEQCELRFIKSYGENLERLVAIKGTANNEAVLMMRLHLMQAIVFFHMNKLSDARRLFSQAERELYSLKVNEDDLRTLISLGYEPSEALLGLRASQGDVDGAIEFITKWAKQRMEARENNVERQRLRREQEKLGKTADGSQYIDPIGVQKLEAMGYNHDLAVCALRHANNTLSQAVFLIQEQRHLLKINYKPTSDDILQVASMGFDAEISRIALIKHKGDISTAIDDLINNNGFVEYDTSLITNEQASAGSSKDAVEKRNPDESGSSNSDDCGSTKETEEMKLKHQEEEKLRRQQEVYALAADISEGGDDYLNTSLNEEEKYLLEYKTLLQE